MERFSNKGKSTLVSGISAGATSLQVAAATSFPTQPEFRLVIGSEILLVTAVAGTTFTVTRGVEGSVAAIHSAGATVFHVITAGALEQLRADAVAGVTGGYNQIQDETVNVTQRTIVDFQGAGVSVTDNGVKTIVTIPGGSSLQFQDEGSNLTQRTTVDFVGGGVAATDTGSKTQVSIPGNTTAVRSTTSSITLNAVDGVVAVGALSASITINLPTSPVAGQSHTIKDTAGSAAAFNIIVSGNGSNIDAGTSVTLVTNYASVTVTYTGSRWSTGAASVAADPGAAVGMLSIPSGAAAGIAQVSGGGGGFTTAYDLDFTTQPSQTFSTNTTYTIDGKTWTKSNSAGDSVAMAIVNGTGLVMQPNASSTNVNAASNTMPMISIPLSSLIPAADFSLFGSTRIWVYFSSSNVAASGDNGVVMIDSGGNGTSAFRYIWKRGNNGGTVGGQCFMGINNTDSGSTFAMTLDATTNVFVCEVPGLLMGNMNLMTGGWSAGFPSLSSLTPRQGRREGNATFRSDLATSSMALCLGAHRITSATALNITIARLKVEWRP